MAKLYVIPVESACNAKCPYCVNQFRNLGNSFLKVGDLEKCLNEVGKLDAIEISGGGEPTLHPQIEKIVELCANKTRTQMYSNGQLVGLLPEFILSKLNPLCISRAHYDSDKNEQIMGVKYSDEIFSKGLSVKLSVVLYKGGVDSPAEAEKYITWAKDKARKVVFRPLFSDVNYPTNVQDKIISLELFANHFGFNVGSGINPKFIFDGVEVEFEIRSCSCENTNPILHADGKLNYTWDSDDINRK